MHGIARPALVARAIVPAAVSLLVLLAMVHPASAATDESDGATTSLRLVVAPLVDPGPEDGDLVADEEVGLPLLSFSPSGPSEQTAALLFTVTNTGDVPLRDLEVHHERIGVVMDAASGTVLEPGASTTVRGVDRYTFEEALVGTSGLVASDVRAAASDGAGTVVEATTESIVQVVVVLATPEVLLEIEPMVGAGDVVLADDGRPTVSWTWEAAAADEPRELRYLVTVSNTGTAVVQDVRATVEVLGVELPVAFEEGPLAVGDERTAEVSHEITPADLPGDTAAGTEAEVVATADLRASAEDGSPAFVRAGTTLTAVVAPEELPATGAGSADGVALGAVVALLLGGALVRRPRSTASGRRR